MTKLPLYLALDQGGHASRALVFDSRGEVHAQAVEPIATQHPAPDRVEHDPEELAASLHRVVQDAVRQLGDSSHLVAAGLATQRSSIVCWDRGDGRALSPVISWQDRRMAAWLDTLRDADPLIRQKTGLVLSPHYGASKLRWCLEHLPAVQKARMQGRLACGPLASFLASRLTAEGNSVVDPANASRTLLFNLDTADWDVELTHLFGIPAPALPGCVPSRHDFGHIRTPRGPVPLNIVTGDQSAALFGFGAPSFETAYINLGTGAFVQRPITARPPPSSLLCSLAYADGATRRYVLEGTVNGAGSALAWACAELGAAEDEVFAQLPHWLSSEQTPPLFINAVAGLGSPYWCATLTPRFEGGGTASARFVSVIESIVFLLVENLAAMGEVIGQAPRQVLVSGGLAQLDGLCQRLADLSGANVRRHTAAEATARGLAWLIAGAEANFHAPKKEAIFVPAANDQLWMRYRRWRYELERSIASTRVTVTARH